MEKERHIRTNAMLLKTVLEDGVMEDVMKTLFLMMMMIIITIQEIAEGIEMTEDMVVMVVVTVAMEVTVVMEVMLK
jgi:hypothetical protein